MTRAQSGSASAPRRAHRRAQLIIEDQSLSTLQTVIESAWERRTELGPRAPTLQLRAAVDECLAGLDAGKLRVAEQRDGRWVVNQWLKQAVLLSFRINDNVVIDARLARSFFDKVPLKFAQHEARATSAAAVCASCRAPSWRRGAYIAPDVRVDALASSTSARTSIEGTMVDTWATVGSCAQIGKRVHLSGGVGIGGVLEPLQAAPTIIEDDCFIGARSEVVEGVDGRATARCSAWASTSAPSTQHLRPRDGRSALRSRAGGLVVVARQRCLPRTASTSLYCAVIVKKVDEKTRSRNVAERPASHRRLVTRVQCQSTGRGLRRGLGHSSRYRRAACVGQRAYQRAGRVCHSK